MRAILLTQLLVVFVSATMAAQTVRPPKAAAPVKPLPGTTFTGCLAKSSMGANEYALTVTTVAAAGTTTASKVYRLMPVAAGVNLAEHVGHRVTITGSQTDASNDKQAAKSANTQLQVRVTDVHHIAPDCK